MGGKGGGKKGKKMPTMSVGVSKENKDMVMNVLQNLKDGCDTEVNGLQVEKKMSVKVVNANPERNALIRNGIDDEIATEVSNRYSNYSSEDRMWKAIELSLEKLAEEMGSTTSTDPEEGHEQQQEELECLSSIPDEIIHLPDGIIEVKIAAHPGSAIHFKGCNDKYYPSKLPLAKYINPDATTAVRFSVHQQLWTKMIEHVGMPILFPILIEMPSIIEEAEAATPTAKAAPRAQPQPQLQPQSTKSSGGGKKGKKGRIVKGGRLDAVKGSNPEKKATRPEMGVPEVFPELSREQINAVATNISTSGNEKSWSGITRDAAVDKTLLSEYNKRITNKVGLPEIRAKLPAAKLCDEVVETVKNNQVVLITGETGCGKTTQVPQFILDGLLAAGEGSTCRMVCTQPRRIAAISIAKRVAQERGSAIGQQVGYSIRLESKQSKNTRLLFCTTGVLLRKLQGDACYQMSVTLL